MPDSPRHLILASASPYRRELLKRIVPEFEVCAAAIDESRHADETPAELARRLAHAKAATVSGSHPGALVIGSDQVAALGDQALGKPGNAANAARQLAACSGQQVIFYTAVTVGGPDFAEQHLDITTVTFRSLNATEIEHYLERDKPWDCAGSFRSEGLGAVLFESVSTQDPSAIVGLPLIWVAGSLRRAGWELL